MMDTTFFWISKLAWLVLSPDSLLLILLLIAWLLLLRGRQRAGRALLGITIAVCFVIALLPLGEWLISPLENRYSAQPSVPHGKGMVDGIIVLGGSIDPIRSAYWKQAQLNETGERLSTFVALARRYPDAQLVFSGGSGNPLSQDLRESDFIKPWLSDLGVAGERLTVERQSRNTWENLQYSHELLRPGPGETWLLVTSAFHMPRAMGVANALDWPMIPWPVDYRTAPAPGLQVKFQFISHLDTLRIAIREWLGLLAYRLADRSAPAP